MSKVRIFELAKELNKPSKDILKELSKVGITGKTHSSSIEEDIAAKIRKSLVIESRQPKTPKTLLKPAVKAEKPKVSPKTEIPEKAKFEKPLKKEITPEVPAKTAEPVAHNIVKEAGKSVTETPAKDIAQREDKKTGTQEEINIEEPKEDDVLLAESKKFKPGVTDVEEDVSLPDRFKKEIEAEKIEKFKAKPSMQRAFQAVRKVEPKKWHDSRFTKRGEKQKFGQKQEQKPVVLSTMPRKKTLKLREGTSVKEFSELIGLKFEGKSEEKLTFDIFNAYLQSYQDIFFCIFLLHQLC